MPLRSWVCWWSAANFDVAIWSFTEATHHFMLLHLSVAEIWMPDRCCQQQRKGCSAKYVQSSKEKAGKESCALWWTETDVIFQALALQDSLFSWKRESPWIIFLWLLTGCNVSLYNQPHRRYILCIFGTIKNAAMRRSVLTRCQRLPMPDNCTSTWSTTNHRSWLLQKILHNLVSCCLVLLKSEYLDFFTELPHGLSGWFM